VEFLAKMESVNITVPPFVVATGRGDENIAVELMKLGARDYIVKDISFLKKIEVVIPKLVENINKEQKLLRIENELKDLNEFNKQIINSATEGIIVFDTELRYLVWNPFMEGISGVKSSEVVGKQMLDAFPFLKGTKIFENRKNTLLGETKIEVEYHFHVEATEKSGWVIETTAPLRNSENEIIGVISTVHDITERKKAEEKIKKQQQEFEELFENAPVGYHEIDPTGKIVRVNNTELALLGYTKEEMLSMNVWQIGENPERTKQIFFDKLSGNLRIDAPYERSIRKMNGSLLHAIMQDILLYDNVGIISGIRTTVQDVEELKRAQNEIINNRDALKTLLFASAELLKFNDKIDFNQLSQTMLEVSGAKYVSFNLFEPNGLDYTTVGFAGMGDFANKSKKYLGFNFFNKRWNYDAVRAEKIKNETTTKFNSLKELNGHIIPDLVSELIEKVFKVGETFVIKITSENAQKGDFTLLFENENTLKNKEIAELFAGQVAMYIDRVNAVTELKENERKFRVLFAENPQPMWIYDLETLRFLEVNNAAIHHYGYSRDEFLELSLTDIIDDEEIPEFLRLIEETRRGKKTDGVSKHKKKNGEKIQVEISSASAPTFGKNARHVLVNDITEKKLAEDKLVESNSLLNATLESTADGILVVDHEGNATIYNQKFAEMWKIPPKILVQKEDEQLLRYVSTQQKDYEEFFNKVTELYKKPEITSGDNIELIDGRVFERYSTPQRIGEQIAGRVWSFRDITDRLKAENELKMKMDEMTRFYNMTVDRELKMIELKKEINELLKKMGMQEKYTIV
jgi:PAS domain S-box-containing protein